MDAKNEAAAATAAAAVAAGDPPPEYHDAHWTPITKTELLGFIGVLLWAGYDRSKKYPIELLWSTDRTFFRPVPPATLSRTRFQVMMRVLRFDDVQARRQLVGQGGRQGARRGAPVADLVRIFDLNLRKYYNPGCLLTVDEMLVKFRGRAPFRVFMKTKPGKYGLKVWIAVDTKSSYITGFQLYEGKPQGGQTERNLGQRVVMDLTYLYYNTGRGITTDNFFTSLSLARTLLQNGLTLLGKKYEI